MLQMNIRNTQLFCKTINGCTGPVEMILSNGKRDDIRSNAALQYMLTDLYPEGRPVCLTLDAKDQKDVVKLIEFMMDDK